MTIEPKLESPISMELSDQGNNTVANENFNERLSLECGIMFKLEHHYGFSIIVNRKGFHSETTYPTQCSIFGIQIVDKKLCIYEDGKYLSWQFDMNGNLIRPATFMRDYRRDLEYLAEKLGITSNAEAEIERINSYVLKPKQ